MKQKPGVMIYFDMLPVLSYLSLDEKGILFEAVLRYGKFGELPSFPEKLEPIWPLIQQRLDFDETRYQNTVMKRKYAAYVRREKQNDRQPLPYTQWLENHGYEADEEDHLNAFAPI